MTFFMDSPLPMVMDAKVTRKVFLEKHADKIVGITPDMLVQAIYRPALVFKEGALGKTLNIVTNILTTSGPGW